MEKILMVLAMVMLILLGVVLVVVIALAGVYFILDIKQQIRSMLENEEDRR